MLISSGKYWLHLTTNYTAEPRFLRKLDDKQSLIKQRNSKNGSPQRRLLTRDGTYSKI